MKTSERQHLKSNEVAEFVARLRSRLEEAGPSVGRALLVAGAVVVLVMAYVAWRNYEATRAEAMLAEALAVEAAPVVPPPMPGTESPAAPARSFPTETARRDAAIEKFQATADRYPSTDAGRLARYRLASLYAEQGKLAEAEREFGRVLQGSQSDLYGLMARLAVADLQVRQGQYDPAIATFRELAARTDGRLPADGILMELGRAQALAGQRAEAIQTFMRVSQEFPQSAFAADAKREADTLRALGS